MKKVVFLFTIILILTNAAFSACNIINSNCQINAATTHLISNSQSYIILDAANLTYGENNFDILNWNIADSTNLNIDSENYNNYYGDGTLNFGVHYLSNYDQERFYTTYYSLDWRRLYGRDPNNPADQLRVDEFNANIGISPTQRLDTLHLTTITNGAFRINGNIYINNLTSDSSDIQIEEYNGYGQYGSNHNGYINYVDDTIFLQSDEVRSVYRETSNIASNIFDVKNPINMANAITNHLYYDGLNFLFDSRNNNNKIINAQFGVGTAIADRFHIIAIENNRNIAQGEVTANFYKDIYAHELQLRTELEPENNGQQIASKININFDNITADIRNINIGTKPYEEDVAVGIYGMRRDFNWYLDDLSGTRYDYDVSKNLTLSAPHSQIAGAIIANNSNIISETFNIGNYGELHIMTNSNKTITTDNAYFATNSKIYIDNSNLNDTIINDYSFFTSNNDIKTADLTFTNEGGCTGFPADCISLNGYYTGTENITRDALLDIIEPTIITDIFYDMTINAYDANGDIIPEGNNNAVRQLQYSMSPRQNISATPYHNILRSIMTSQNNNLDNIRTAMRSKNNIAEIESLTRKATRLEDFDGFTTSGAITNQSDNIVNNRIANSMKKNNIAATGSSFNFNNNNISALQSDIINIYNRRYSNISNGTNNNSNVNFAQLMSHDISTLSFNNVGVWVQPFGSIYDYSGMDAFDANIYGILAGVDKKFSNMFNKNYRSLFGASYGYFISDIDSANGSNLEITSNQLSFYNANYHKSGLGLYNKNILSLTFNNNDFNRSVNDNGINILDANANYDSDQYHLSSSIGYVAELYDMVNANKFLRNLLNIDTKQKYQKKSRRKYKKKKGKDKLAFLKKILITTDFALGYNYFTSHSYDESGSGILQSVNNAAYGNFTTNLSVKLSGKHKNRKSRKKSKKEKPTIYILGKYATEYLPPEAKYSFKPAIAFSWLRNHTSSARKQTVNFSNLVGTNSVSNSNSNIANNIFSTELDLELLNLDNGDIIDLSYKLEKGSDLIGHSAYVKYAKRF